MPRSMKSCTSGSSRMTSVGRAGERRDRVHRHVAPELVPDVAADVGARLGLEAGAGERGADRGDALGGPPRGSPTISRSPKLCRTRPGSGIEQARWTTQPSTRSSGSGPAGARRGRRWPAAPGPAALPAGTTRARRSSPAARPWSATIRAAIESTAPASAGALSATITSSCGPSERGIVADGQRCRERARRAVDPQAVLAHPRQRRAARERRDLVPGAARRAAISPPTAPRPDDGDLHERASRLQILKNDTNESP